MRELLISLDWWPVLAPTLAQGSPRHGVLVSYLYGDHLGSISGETEALLSGYRYMVPLSGRSEDPDDYPPPAFDPLPEAEPRPMQRYYPYGATRSGYAVSVSYQYTGQRHEAALGLYYYNARWYDPSIGRFIQADSIVPEPGNPQSLNRYAYVYNNPLRYTDPSGRLGDDMLVRRTRRLAIEQGTDMLTVMHGMYVDAARRVAIAVAKQLVILCPAY